MIRKSIVLVLCGTIALSGCATGRLPGTRPARIQPDSQLMAEYVRKLPPGSKVRVDTAEGRSLRGTLIDATSDEIVVQRQTRVPVAPEAIPLHDVARVTVDPGSSAGKWMGVGAAIGAGAAIATVWIVALLAFAD
jgi:hypothetical protein